MKPHPRSLLCVLTAAAVSCWSAGGVSRAQIYYAQANQTGSNGQTWDQLSAWFDQTSGGGNNPTTLSGNAFNSQGFSLRTGTGNFTFGNASTTLTLAAGSGNGLIVRAGPSNTSTIPNLITEGGRITAGVGTASIAVTNFTNSTGASIRPEDAGTQRTINLTVGTLTGTGDFSLTNGGTLSLNVSSAGSYEGDFTFAGTAATTLDFQNDLVSGGGLIVTDANSRVFLDQNVTFAGLTINGASLSPGTYTWNDLSTNFSSTIFVAGGSGSITVVPEPGTLSLLGLALGLAGRVRRRTSRALAKSASAGGRKAGGCR